MTSSPAVTQVLSGMDDMHCHSGPSPMPRPFAMAGRLTSVSTIVFGGIAPNSRVGRLTPHAARMNLRMGGKVAWFPRISSGRHIEWHPGPGKRRKLSKGLRLLTRPRSEDSTVCSGPIVCAAPC